MTSFSPDPYHFVWDTEFSDILAITISTTRSASMDDDTDDYEYQQKLAENGEDYVG